MYHAARFDPSSTYDQTFTIKVDFGKAYLIHCFKYKTDNEQEFALRIDASKQNDAWFGLNTHQHLMKIYCFSIMKS